jgi:hypothetical protein
MSYNLKKDFYSSDYSTGCKIEVLNPANAPEDFECFWDDDFSGGFNRNEEKNLYDLDNIVLNIKRDNLGLESIFGMNFISLYNEENEEYLNSPYYDYIVFPNNPENQCYSGIFEMRLYHVTKDDFYRFISEYCSRQNEADFISLNGFYDYLNERNVSLKILQ